MPNTNPRNGRFTALIAALTLTVPTLSACNNNFSSVLSSGSSGSSGSLFGSSGKTGGFKSPEENRGGSIDESNETPEDSNPDEGSSEGSEGNNESAESGEGSSVTTTPEPAPSTVEENPAPKPTSTSPTASDSQPGTVTKTPAASPTTTENADKSDPADSKPAESKPVAPEVSEPESAVTNPIENQPDEPNPNESNPAESHTDDANPEEPNPPAPIVEEPSTPDTGAAEPTESQPSSERPEEEDPHTEEPVSEQPPAVPPASEVPVEEPPAEEQPVVQPPVEEPPAEEPPAEEPSTAPVVEPANPGVPEEPVDETPEQEEPASADPTSSSPTSSAAEEPAHSEDSSSTSTSTSPTSSTSEQPAEPESKDHIEATPQDSTSDSISFDAARKVQFYGANAVILASANQARSGHVAKLTSVDGIERYLEVDSVRTADNGNILVTFKQPNGANYAAGENTVQPGAVLELDSSGAVVDNITRHADYNASKSAVYENLRRLGPWVDIARVVANGNAVSSPSLASSQVNAVLPLDQAGARVLVMDEAGAKSVKSVKIAFDDAAPVVYPARFAGATGEIANFDVDVDGTTVRYQYSGVYLKNGLAAYAAVISRAKGLNSSQVLNSWDSAADKALLKENFEGINGHEGFRSARLERMLSAMIASQPQCVALEGVSVMGAMRECGFLNSKLTDTVQHLNWLDRAFDFDMGGTRMADWLAASSNVDRLGPAPDANTIIERSTHYKVRYRDTDGKTKRKMAYHLGSLQYAGYRLRYIYEDIVPGGNGRTIMEHLISHYTKFNTDYDAWLKASFEGLIIEPKVGMQVSTWDHLARFTYDMRDERYEEGMSIPAFMTTHAQKMYMAVLPGYIIFGNGDAYSEPANRDQRVITWEQLPGELQAFVDKLAGWLENINGVIPGFSERLEKKLYRVWDAPHNGVRSYYQDTNDAMLHRFGWLYSGRISDVAFENNYAAYRVDDFVFFGNSAFLFNYATITHEFTHLMDGGPMFNDKGRRTGGGNTEIGAESFAAGMFEQSFGMGNMAPNWTGSGFGGWDAISNNEPSRVNTPAGFQSYYAGLFDVLYTLEYAMGQAFLKLDTNSQKKLAMTTEPIGGGGGAAGRVTGYYGYNGRADLKDMEDLWDNRVVIRPAIPRNDSLGWNDYGAVGSIDTMWYVPNNDEGFSDSQSFKLQAFMMAAANGWDGMSAVVSGRKTDPQAITEATNGKYTSWKQFKLDQWDRVAREMPAEQMKALIDACEKALRSDAQRGGYTSNNALRNKILLGVKKQTNDFESSYTTVDYKTLLE